MLVTKSVTGGKSFREIRGNMRSCYRNLEPPFGNKVTHCVKIFFTNTPLIMTGIQKKKVGKVAKGVLPLHVGSTPPVRAVGSSKGGRSTGGSGVATVERRATRSSPSPLPKNTGEVVVGPSSSNAVCVVGIAGRDQSPELFSSTPSVTTSFELQSIEEPTQMDNLSSSVMVNYEETLVGTSDSGSQVAVPPGGRTGVAINLEEESDGDEGMGEERKEGVDDGDDDNDKNGDDDDDDDESSCDEEIPEVNADNGGDAGGATRNPPPNWEVPVVVLEDIDVPPFPIRDMMETLTKNRGRTLQKQLIKQLWTMSCTLVYDEIYVGHERMRKQDLYVNASKCMFLHLKSFPCRQYVQQEFMEQFFGGQWPPFYLTFVHDLFEKKCARNEERFGKIIHEVYKDCRAYIWAWLNDPFPVRVPSGKLIEQYLLAIRKSTFVVEVNRLAKNSTKMLKNRIKHLPEKKVLDDTTAHYFDARKRAWNLFDQSWCPPCWLTYLMFGLPAPVEHQITSLTSHQGTNTQPPPNTINPLGTKSQAAAIQSPLRNASRSGRNARRALNAADHAARVEVGGIPAQEGVNPQGREPLQVDHRHHHDLNITRAGMTKLERQREAMMVAQMIDPDGQLFKQEAQLYLAMLKGGEDEKEQHH